MKLKNLNNLNGEALAYMGDVIYEKYVREKLLLEGTAKVNNLHKKAVNYVRADAQAKAIHGLFDNLTEKEQALVKRARNHRFHSKAKNADVMTYKWATAFEALVGYTYLAEDNERLEWIIQEAIRIIEEA